MGRQEWTPPRRGFDEHMGYYDGCGTRYTHVQSCCGYQPDQRNAGGTKRGLFDALLDLFGGVGPRGLDPGFHGLDTFDDVHEPGFDPALYRLGFLLGEFALFDNGCGGAGRKPGISS